MKKLNSVVLILLSTLLFVPGCSNGGGSTTSSQSSSSSVPQHTHTLSKHAATESTCKVQGNSEYYECSTCHKYFSDSEGKKEIAKDSWVLDYGPHSLEEHAAHDPTCTEAGNSLYYSCDVCFKYFSDNAGSSEITEGSWVIDPTGHEYDFEHASIVNPTTTKEGSLTVSCKNCPDIKVFKLARLTELSLDDTSIKWSVVIDDTTEENEATSYKVYVDDTLLETVGPTVLSYNISDLDTGNHKVEVVAMFDNEDYIEGDGGQLNINVSLSTKSVFNASINNPVYNGAGNYSIEDIDNEKVLKLDANGGVNWDWNNYNVSTLYGVTNTFPTGTYEVSVDVKLGEKVSNQIFYYGSYDQTKVDWFPGYRHTISLDSCSTTEWTTIKTTYTISEQKSGQPEIAFGSLATSLNTNSYLLVKNATFSKVDTDASGTTYTQYENVFPRESLIHNGWGNGSTILNNIEDNVVAYNYSKENGHYICTYTEGTNIPFTLAGVSSNIESLGTYKMSLEVQLGPNASNVNNIGFRCWTENGVKPWDGDNVFDLSPLQGKEGFVTLTKDITVKDNSNTGWMNIDFWVFTHNDEIQSEDNYVLLRNFSLRKVNVSLA